MSCRLTCSGRNVPIFQWLTAVAVAGSLIGCQKEEPSPPQATSTGKGVFHPFNVKINDGIEHVLYRDVSPDEFLSRLPSGSVDSVDLNLDSGPKVIAMVKVTVLPGRDSAAFRFATTFHTQDGQTIEKIWKAAGQRNPGPITGMFVVPPAVTEAETALLPADEWLMNRIGSGKKGSVPVEIRVSDGGEPCTIRIVGKDDLVGALVTREEKSHNIRLFRKDLDVLSALALTDQPSNEKDLIVQIQATRNASFASLRIAHEDTAAILIRRLIYINGLPEYRVQYGDTFLNILSDKLGNRFSRKEILNINPGLDPDHLSARQCIKLPRTQ